MRIRLAMMTVLISCLAVGPGRAAEETPGTSPDKPTHKQVRVIRPSETDTSLRLNTYAISPAGHIWMCCSGGSTGGQIVVVDAEGQNIRTVQLNFAPQAINFSKQGIPFIAGSGKVARLTAEGETDLVVDAPNLASPEEMQQRMQQRVQAQIDRMVEGLQSQADRMKEQVNKLEQELEELGSDPAQDRIRGRNESRLKILKQQLESSQSIADQMRKQYEEMFAQAGAVDQVKKATGLSVSDQDVFVSLPSWEGFGYAIYRMTHELSEPQLITDSVSGCCGQLDIQSDGKNLLIAMNSAFKVGTYDRDGKSIASFGERKSAGDETGWGSCCNPMNIRCLDNGEVLVAESSIGHLKRYTPEGKFLGLVGTARIAGGCKHVAVAMHPERNWYYMMNTAANNIAVLVPNEEAPAETEDERESRLAMQGLGAQLIGAWKAEPAEANQPKTAALQSGTGDDAEDADAADSFDFGQYIVQQHQFLRLDANGRFSRTEPVVASTSSSGGLLSALGTLFTGTSSRSATVQPVDESLRWEAIKQVQDVVYFALSDDGIRNYIAGVRFLEDGRAEFQWFYDDISGSPLTTVTYRRVAGPSAEEQACAQGKCDPAKCTLPDCKHPAAEAPASTGQ